MIVLRNCRFVDELTEGYDSEYGDMLIDENIIRSIKKIGFDFGSNIPEVDLDMKTVIPGLIDLHTHLSLDSGDYARNLLYPPQKVFWKSYEFAKEYLKAGYTTVRDMGTRNNVTKHINDAINEGVLEGPRIISCGQILSPTETGNEEFGDMYIEADGKYEFAKAARQQYKLGNDFSKVMVTGSFLNTNGDPGQLVITLDELKSVVEVARLKKSYVAAHCHSVDGIRCAIKAGVRTIEHACFIDDKTIKMLKEKKNTYIVPTAAIGMECLADGNETVTDDAYEKGKIYEKIEKKALNSCYLAGLKLGFGSDIDMESFKRVIGYEFIARKEFYNFKDKDILLQATKNNSEIANLDSIIGTLKEGKIADLVVINGKPDIDIYSMTKPPVMVIKNGKII